MAVHNEWFFARGSLAQGSWDSVVDGSVRGWQHTGIRVAEIVADESLALAAGPTERMIVPLVGSFAIAYDDVSSSGSVNLGGRASVFDGPTDVLYLGSGASATITGAGRIAVAESPTAEVHPIALIRENDIAVELRGAGQASRQVHNFGTLGAVSAARLIVCEVITPAGNWSSFPAHKHDEAIPGVESQLEEIYYFESAVTRGDTVPAVSDPHGYMRTYSSPVSDIDTFAEVRTGDIALVPHGWHGPCVAMPGYDLYYLNIMAGPGERGWNISDDPAHTWVRDEWKHQAIDPRLPYVRRGSGQ